MRSAISSLIVVPFSKKAILTSYLILLLTLCLPCAGYWQPREQPDGSRIIPLRKVPRERATLRNFEEEDPEDEIFFEPSLLWQGVEMLFGKSEETLYWEKAYKEMKQKIKHKHNRLLVLSDTHEPYYLENTDGLNYEYLMQVYVGSEGKEMSVTFDTGSDWTILQSYNCSSCHGDMWNYTESSSFNGSEENMTLWYGSATVFGYLAQDAVYLDKNQSFGVDVFDVFLIDKQDGISPSGGIMGFSRNHSFYGYPAGPLYYYYLYEDGLIDDLIFASYLADHPEESFIQVGGYDTVGEFYTSELIWLELEDNFFWMSSSSGYIYKGETTTISPPFSVNMDTGTSLLYLDKKYGRPLVKKMLRGRRGFRLFQIYFLDCDLDNFESVFFELGGYYFEIPPSSLVRNFQEHGYKFCDLGFRFGKADGWLFGDTLFRSYYNVWDEENGRVGFALRTGSDATTAPYPSS